MPTSRVPSTNELRDRIASICLMVTIALMLVIGIVSYQTTRRFLVNDALVERSHEAISMSDQVLSDLRDAETGQRGFLLTGSDDYLEPYTLGVAAVAKDLDALADLTSANPNQKANMQLLRTATNGKLAELKLTVDTERSQGYDAALVIVKTNRGKFLMDNVRSAIGNVKAEATRRLALRTRDAENAAEEAQRWSVGGYVSVLILMITALLYIDRYISERQRAEREVRALNQDLERRVEDRTAALLEANRELEAFSYSVSHDLRAPLRHISGFAEMLRKKAEGQLDETCQRYVLTIQESGQHAGALVDDLLAFSRMGKAEMRLGVVDMNSIVAAVRKDLAIEIDQRDVQWKVDELPPAYGDSSMLRLVWQNLIGNAVKYTKKRSTATIEIGAKSEAGETIYFVRDNGAGFDMRYVDKLFGVFQRLHGKEEFEGTGIGLANVRRIVNRHFGRTWAEGEVDNGATFYFTLPNKPKASGKV